MIRMRHALVAALCLAVVVSMAPLASAQPDPPPVRNPAIGESYRVEFLGGVWNPTPEAVLTSDFLGIPSSDIDFVADLGIAKKRFPEFHVVLRPGRKHKFRIQHVPITYESNEVLQRSVVFRGIRFSTGLPVTANLRWQAWRLGYEYDFIYRDRWFVGAIVEAKYTDLEAALDSSIANEFIRARAPIPALGGIGRVYVVPNASVTFELTGIKLPSNLDEEGQYIDVDFYGTVNFLNNFGVQVGYRSIGFDFLVEEEQVDVSLKGTYVAGVVRF